MLGALDQAVARDHAAGELLEGLIENVLPPVGGDHAIVDRQAIERGEAALGDALAGGFLLDVGQEAVEAALVIALRGQCRRGGDEHGARENGRYGSVNF